jgi:hypothetical protein
MYFNWKTERKRPLGRPRRRWEDTINMYIEEQDVSMWTGFMRAMTRASGGLF